MRRKNIILIGIIIALLAVNMFIFKSEGLRSSVSFDSKLFTVKDTSAITKVTISNAAGDLILSKGNGSWSVNQSYPMDEGLRRLFFSILQRVEVKRTVEMPIGDGIEVSLAGDQPMHFKVFGNPTRTKTYFVMEDEAYEMEIPGYKDYLGSIFELSTHQWRDRSVLEANWRTIQNLSLRYEQSENGFDIVFDDQFFTVSAISRLDSNKVVEYLNLFDNFQMNEWIDLEKLPKYDSLSRTQPLAELVIESINYSKSVKLVFYSLLNGDRIYLVRVNGDDWGVVDRKRVHQILVEKNYFSLKE